MLKILQSTNLSYCGNLTDIGVSALSAGCGQLRSINLTGCGKVTDAARSSLRMKKKDFTIYS